MKEWINPPTQPELFIIYSYNFLDFSDQDEPFKTSITLAPLGDFDDSQEIDATIPLRLNDVELADDIFDPLGLDAN